jgi:cobalamin transport system ATP-binding protein
MKLTINSIDFSYENSPILKDITCSFTSGKFYSIIGPNGSGKTTLLDLVSGFLKAQSGSINLDTKNICSFRKNELAKQISLVSQDYGINFPFSVQEVVMMGRHPHIPRFSQSTDEDKEIVKNILSICEIAHLKDRKITELSGGERQRSVFARALCQDTPILLLDEAFSNMDISHTLQMLKLVRRLVIEKDKIVISVFHDLNLASCWSDELIMLKNGRIKAMGNTQDILTIEKIKDVFNVDSVVEFNQRIQSKQVCYPKA